MHVVNAMSLCTLSASKYGKKAARQVYKHKLKGPITERRKARGKRTMEKEGEPTPPH